MNASTATGTPSSVATKPASAVDDRRMRDARAREEARAGGHGLRAFEHVQRAAALVGAQDDVGVEDREQPLEVAAVGGGQERVHDLAVGGGRLGVGALHAPPRPRRELTRRGRRAVHDRRDVLERHREQVVQDERQALGGLQRLQHDEQRGADRVGGQRHALGIGRSSARDHRVRQPPLLQRLLAPALARVEHRQAHARDDRRQPAAQVLDVARVGAVEPQPRLLQRVVGLRLRAQHARRHRVQMRAVCLEFVHLVTSSRFGRSSP